MNRPEALSGTLMWCEPNIALGPFVQHDEGPGRQKKVSPAVENRVRIKSDETSFFGAEKRNQTFENFRAITF